MLGFENVLVKDSLKLLWTFIKSFIIIIIIIII